MKILTRDLTPVLWKDLQALFGEKGACGGCWCMHWRIEKGEKWEKVKGPVAKTRFRKLVVSGEAHGVLAYIEGAPVGWCAYDRRIDYDRLNRAPSWPATTLRRSGHSRAFTSKPVFADAGSRPLCSRLPRAWRRSAELASSRAIP